MKSPLPLIPLLVLLVAYPVSALPFSGPLEVKNQFPLFLHLNTPFLERAALQDSLALNFSYSSVFLNRNTPRWSVQMDLELAELTLRFRKTLSCSLEIGLDLPVLSFNSGVMDPFLDWYHSTFGFPDYGRSSRPFNQFLYQIRTEKGLIVKGENGKSGLGDLRISGKQVLLESQGRPLLSLSASMEIPTGDPNQGFGNGSLDFGLALLVEKKLSPTFQAYGNLGLVIPGTLKAHQELDLKKYYYGGVGLEAAVSKNISFLGQVWGQSSPFPETGIGAVDNPALLLSLGGRYHLNKSYLELSFTEDVNTSGAPDFIVNFSIRRKF